MAENPLFTALGLDPSVIENAMKELEIVKQAMNDTFSEIQKIRVTLDEVNARLEKIENNTGEENVRPGTAG